MLGSCVSQFMFVPANCPFRNPVRIFLLNLSILPTKLSDSLLPLDGYLTNPSQCFLILSSLLHCSCPVSFKYCCSSVAHSRAVLTVNYVVQDGKSNWLEGMILMCMYLGGLAFMSMTFPSRPLCYSRDHSFFSTPEPPKSSQTSCLHARSSQISSIISAIYTGTRRDGSGDARGCLQRTDVSSGGVCMCTVMEVRQMAR